MPYMWPVVANMYAAEVFLAESDEAANVQWTTVNPANFTNGPSTGAHKAIFCIWLWFRYIFR